MLLNDIYKGINTIHFLDAVEAERDQWQRPEEIIRALNLRQGGTVVDLGCGSGYFALKLSGAVGKEGQVVAADIRRLSLLFLWIRSLLRNQHNVTVTHVHPDRPNLPAGTADAVLIANTYHEFQNPKSMLNHVFRSLAPGGRVVIADRGPPVHEAETEGHHHDVPVASVELELLHTGFEIVTRNDRLIDSPQAGHWWLIAARKP